MPMEGRVSSAARRSEAPLLLGAVPACLDEGVRAEVIFVAPVSRRQSLGRLAIGAVGSTPDALTPLPA
jgi:hypothetical protein